MAQFNAYVESVNPSKIIRLTAMDLQNDDWVPSGNIESQQIHILRDKTPHTARITMNPTSLYEAWSFPIQSNFKREGTRTDNVALLFE